MLLTMITERIHEVSFQFEQDQSKESLRLNTEQRARRREHVASGMLAIGQTDCPNMVHIGGPRSRRSRRPEVRAYKNQQRGHGRIPISPSGNGRPVLKAP